MADIIKEPWMNPAKNVVAANGLMQGRSVAPVMLIGVDGEPYTSGSDGGGVPVEVQDGLITNIGDTAAKTSVASSATSVLLSNAEINRVSLTIVNDSTEILYVSYGSAATISSYTHKLYPDETLISNDYSGNIYGVWSSVNGDAKVTEVTKSV